MKSLFQISLFLTLFLFTGNYNRIASDLCALAKDQGSRDNITVIIVYLKEPELIASQPWTSEIASQNIRNNMDNLNLNESEQVAPQQQQPQPIVSMDALGNTNQVKCFSKINFYFFYLNIHCNGRRIAEKCHNMNENFLHL